MHVFVTDGRKNIEGEIGDRLNHTHTKNANIIQDQFSIFNSSNNDDCTNLNFCLP